MITKKRLWSASFTTSPEAADLLSNALGDNALSLATIAPPRTGKAEVEAIFDAPPDLSALQTRIDILASLNGIKPPRIQVRELPSLDWLKKVAEDFPPLPIARWVVFGAQHKQAAQKHHRIPLQIDATSAFGTGEHPTTRGCLLMLDWVLKGHFKRNFPSPGGRGQGWGPSAITKHRYCCTPHSLALPAKGRECISMLDMGCGSGILAMAYAKATHSKATGVDLDVDSVIIARGNIRANGLQHYMRVALGNGYHTSLVQKHKPYDLIMANIFAGPLCRMAYDLKQHLKPNGVAILSGLLTHQANKVIAAHRMQGLRLMKHMKLGEWSVLAFQRGA